VGAFSYWAPKFLYTRYGLPLVKANFYFGTITVVAGALGTILGGRLADRSVQHVEDERRRVLALLRICGIGSALGVPAAFACFVSPTPVIFFVCVFFTIVFLFVNTSPINAIVLQSVPPEIRGRAMALSIFAIHVLGDLWSPMVSAHSPTFSRSSSR
jgi:MFS family permease